MDKHPFDYQKPTEAQVEVISEFRQKCKDLYEYLLTLPHSRERSLAITQLEQVSMWGNKCIVFHVEG